MKNASLTSDDAPLRTGSICSKSKSPGASPAPTIIASALRPLAALAGALLCNVASAQVVFNLAYDPTIDPRALAGFHAAAARWSSLLADPITVSINFQFLAETDDVGGTDPTVLQVDYTTYLQAISRDRTSAIDASAARVLGSSSQTRTLINRTAENPHGFGSSLLYLDDNYSANNLTVAMTLANARALGLYAARGGETDATIFVRSGLRYDFDPSDGIDAGSVDFVGIATHELGHALGFVSGTTLLDESGLPLDAAYSEDDLPYISSLDLFRYSRESAALGRGVIDWSADDREKYFSVDGGDTSLGLFSTGVIYGDGEEASHWKRGLGLGAMDPWARPGLPIHLSTTDLLAFDAIGYDLQPVPEPATLGLAGASLLLGVAALRGRHRRRVAQIGRIHVASLASLKSGKS